MNWYPLAQLPLTDDYSELSQILWQAGLAHRFTEEKGHQCLWLPESTDAEHVKALAEQWKAGLIVPKSTSSQRFSERFSESVQRFLTGPAKNAPLTIMTLVLGFLGAMVVWLDATGTKGWLSLLTFTGFIPYGDRIAFIRWQYTLSQFEVWRLVSPAFLHFGALHYLSNSVWIWVFGARLEAKFGSLAMGSALLFLMLISNMAQYWWSGPSLFGGLSGVVYGLLGFILVYQRVVEEPAVKVPNVLAMFMLLWLVLGMVGGIDLFIEGSIANGAHLGGLLAGVALGLATRRFQT
ncbi:rhomboid family intramembrane serine protease [Marinibactrum halimedae]|uniref:Rhomboid family intramembrane serine protease n=1 Tax=Marinibactrum halimedae TaxID=1444977 RepID=A0AA37TDX1_9GAMM|nr:rhomboid family intramembrane serine protease [Marinibactrum halimedae]MCD9459496.1 rhomboid family intramembrane serine protease [Marinibactrum halimedae]GLS28150.1 rhomboid family intramembrane serine protease [Marinibactrum halimedae]